MPSFNNIDNGESGLSVRNTLNEVIDFVNTGITSGFTFITEDTTVGSENVIISVTDGTNIGQIQTFGDSTINISSTDGTNESSVAFGGDGTINIFSTDGTDVGNFIVEKSQISSSVTDGSNTGSINTFGDGTINISSTDGTKSEGSISTSGDGTINIFSTDGTNSEGSISTSGDGTINIFSTDGTITSTQTIIPNDVTTLVDATAGTSGAYDAILDIKDNNFRVQILNDSLSSFFNIANDIVIYFPSDDSTFNPIDIDQITIIGPVFGLPNGMTQLHLNGAQGISNTFEGEQCFVITPDLGGTGTETIPTLPIQSTSTITLNSTQVLLNRTGVSTTNEIDISDNSIVLSSTDSVDTNVITLTPTNLNISNLPAFDDDTDASTLSTGDLYQTTGLGASPLDVAGILMIKQ